MSALTERRSERRSSQSHTAQFVEKGAQKVKKRLSYLGSKRATQIPESQQKLLHESDS